MQRYVVPLIKPPTPPELENDKALITAKFDEAQQTLDLLKSQTAELKESQEQQRKKIDEALESVEKAVADLEESGKRREADIRSFKADIDSIRELIPKVPFSSLFETQKPDFQAMDRNKEAQNLQLQDLQNELKSLKSLLLHRTSQRSLTPAAGSGLPSSTAAPGLNTAVPNINGSPAAGGASEAPNPATLSARSETPPPSGSGTGSPLIPSRPGIPAWQLAAREKAQQNSKAEEEKESSVPPASS